MKLFSNSEPHPSAYLDGVPYRGFKIIQDREFFLYEVHTLDTSQLPHVLTGRYTNLGLVRQAIDEFLEKSEKGNEQENTGTTQQG